jgi:hypothetical protein
MTLMWGEQMMLFVLNLRSRRQVRDNIRAHADAGPNQVVSETDLFPLPRLHEK